MSQNENAAMVPDEEHDNLAELDGIGERYSAGLAKAGVNSFNDLVKYTPKTLSEALKERAGLKISEKRIDSQNWIGQARQALGRKKLPAVRMPPPKPTPEKPEEWKERGTFTVSFESRMIKGEEVWQTLVYDDEPSGEELPLPGISIDTWANRILDKAGLQALAQEAQTEPNRQTDTTHTEIERLKQELDALNLSLSAAQDEAAQAKARAEKLENALQNVRQELETARTEATKAKAEAKTSTEAIESVKQQAQAQIDAAFQAAAAAQGMHRSREAAETANQNSQVVTPSGQRLAPEELKETTTSARRPTLQVRIQNVMVEDNDSGKISFVIEGNQALMVTRLKPDCVIEIRGVNPHGNASTLLAKIATALAPNQLVYEVPFMLRIPRPGAYDLFTTLRLTTVVGLITAAHRGGTIVQPSSAPSTSAQATGS